MDSGRGFMEEIPEDLYDKAESKYPKKSGVFQSRKRSDRNWGIQ